MQAVNLLPAEALAPRRPRTSVGLLAGAAVPFLAASLVLAGYTSARSAALDRQAALDAARAEAAALAPARARAEAGARSRLAAERSARLDALVDALAADLRLDRTLVDLSRVVPASVWLTTLSAQAPAAGAPNPLGFTASGYASSTDEVALLLERLALLPALKDVTLGSTTSVTLGTRELVKFDVAATVRPPRGKAAA